MGGMSVSSEGPSDVATLSFEQARDELVRVVAELEQGAPTLEQSLALWERGEALAERCEEWLLGAKRRLDAARTSASTGGMSANRAEAAEGGWEKLPASSPSSAVPRRPKRPPTARRSSRPPTGRARPPATSSRPSSRPSRS